MGGVSFFEYSTIFRIEGPTITKSNRNESREVCTVY